MAIEVELATLVAEVDANLSHLETIAHGLTQEQFNWRPGPGRWSIGGCIAHLNFQQIDLPSIEAAIARGRARNITGQGPFTLGLLSRKWVASQDLPVTRKFKAAKRFSPPSEVDLGNALTEYRRIQAELRRLMQNADGLHLGKVRVLLPALPSAVRWLFKMPLGALFALGTAHDRRHLWQAEQVRSDPAFPQA